MSFAPPVRIMGLIHLCIDPETSLAEKKEISEYLVLPTNEMDQVIRNITDTTCTSAI